MHSRGFTLIELIVVLGVVSTLLAFSTINLLRVQRHTQLQSLVSTLTADMYEQRQRAMEGDTQGRSTIDSYGIYFQTNSYTLFHGSSYVANATDNITVTVSSPLSLSATTFPSSTLIYTKGSGELPSYSSSANSVTITDSSNSETITITVNKYGSITSSLP